jgi:hypothetical protein
MVGVKEICALLLAGGMGAGSVVAVQQAKPAISKPKKATAPKAHKTASRNVTRSEIRDCPAMAAPLGAGIAELAPLPSFESIVPGMTPSTPQVAVIPGGIDILPGGGGGGSGPSILPPGPVGPPAGVPQPASWAMMVTGFGLVGLAMRKGGEPAEAATNVA